MVGIPCIGYRATGIVAGGVREFLEIPIEYEVKNYPAPKANGENRTTVKIFALTA